MKLTVVSMFRDSIMWKGQRLNHVKQYVENMRNQSIGIDNIQFLWIEGDSTDNTLEELQKVDFNKRIITMNVGQPYQGLTSVPSRLKQLSAIGDRLVKEYNEMEETSWVFYVESDVIIQDKLLLERLIERDKDIIAPLIMMGTAFYDTWGFVDIKGQQFRAAVPYSATFISEGNPAQILSCGTALMMRSHFFKNGSFGENALRHFCEHARKTNGARIYVDQTLQVSHPSRVHEGRRI